MSGVLYANPFTSPELYNVLITGGEESPGVCALVDGGGRPYKWDIKDQAGAQGASITYRGFRPSEGIAFKFKFWTAAQVDDFYNRYVPLLAYDATKTNPKPISVLHPVLMANDISSLVTDEIGPLTHEGQQLWTVTIKFTEYRPAKKKNVTSTPTGTTPSANSAAKPTVQDAQDQEISKLLAQAAAPL